VALATGMAWLAHGSDMGGSLRNPASFCGVVGMRPSPGRVARSRIASLSGMLSVEGPMARDVEDLALMLDAMAGAERRDPVSLPSDGTSFLAAARGGPLPRRVAFSRDLGVTPVEPEVAVGIETAAAKLAAAGVIVEEAHPDLSEAHDCFQVLRALSFATGLKDLLAKHGDALKPEIVWNVEKGLKLTVEEIIGAEQQRVAMFDRTIAFFERYDLLLAPATITTAFPVEQRYLAECNGHRFGNYVEWLAIAYAITLVACPAISIPAGFTKEHLPIGLQIVGPPQSEASVLRGAKLMQDVLDLGPITPIEPREPRQ
jgi:amidase